MDEKICEYYSNVAPKQVEWLWFPYIPYGKLSVIQGDPGEGKSTFILNIAAMLTRGLPMPDGYESGRPKTVIYQCAEDGIADTIKPRLEQAGADCEKVAYIVDDDLALTLTDGRIETAIKETGARLFIIDPIQAFIPPDMDMLSATKMRSVLRKLAGIAEEYSCAVVLIGHMNKGVSGNMLYRGLGSIDIAAIARSILMISRDEVNPNIRYMRPVKSSLAPEGHSIAFTFKKGGGIEWHGSYELLDENITNEGSIKISKMAKARLKMLQLLEGNSLPAKYVYKELALLGIGSRTVEKVKKELNVTTYRSGECWYWALPK